MVSMFEEEAEDIMMTASLREALVGPGRSSRAAPLHWYHGAGLRASLQLADAAAVEPPLLSHHPGTPPPAPCPEIEKESRQASSNLNRNRNRNLLPI